MHEELYHGKQYEKNRIEDLRNDVRDVLVDH